MAASSIEHSAQIIVMPGAASSPVVQHPRRGRYPRGVVSPVLFALLASQNRALRHALLAKVEEMKLDAKKAAKPDPDVRLERFYLEAAEVVRSFIGKKDVPEDLIEWALGKSLRAPRWVYGLGEDRRSPR